MTIEALRRRPGGRRAAASSLMLPALAIALLACGRKESPVPARPPASEAPAATPPPAGDVFIPFEEAAAAAGLVFKHVNGAIGQKYMMETLGAGVCVFDYDNDGLQDIYFVQSGGLPGYHAEGPPPRAALFRNLGSGRFEAVPGAAGLADPDHYGMGCVAGDIDGDGDRDLYVTGFGRNVLFVNDGHGAFHDATAKAGLAGGGWGASATLFDADGDGDLDLYVANYVIYDLANTLYCGENRPGYRTVCHPKNFDSAPDRLYRNRGAGTFEDVSERSGVVDRTGKGLGVVAGDLDGDGDEDLYVANDDTPNFLWRNHGDGTFDEEGEGAGVALSEDGAPQAGMGVDMADYDGDGRPDLVVTNLSEETNELYRNEGDGTFSNTTFSSGIGPPSLLSVGFGALFFDPDNDGDLDLFVANGHIIDNIGLYSDTITFEQAPLLYRNRGNGRLDVPKAEGALARRLVGRGAVRFDVDDDGDEDIVVSQNDRPAILLRNERRGAGHWLTMTLSGRAPNRDAIGALVVLESGGKLQWREARTASSYLSQADRRMHFGLGDGTTVDRLRVRWPGKRGGWEAFEVPGIDRGVTLQEGAGQQAPSGN